MFKKRLAAAVMKAAASRGRSHAYYVFDPFKKALHGGNDLLDRLHKSNDLSFCSGDLVERVLHFLNAAFQLICVKPTENHGKNHRR